AVLAAGRVLRAEAARSVLERLRDGAGEEVDLQPLPVTDEQAADPRAFQVRRLLEDLAEAGYAEPEPNTAISDPLNGRVLAEAEAFWPDGLQRGIGKPVVLELDPGQADLPRLQELGYEVFTSVDSLRGFVERSERESSGVHPVQAPEPEEQTSPAAPEEPDAAEFGRAMKELYERAKSEADYTATYFLGMLAELGPLGTARKLLNAPAVSDGFANLWERGRLDLTMEALVLDPRFAALFAEEELERARTRLAQFGYRFPGE